MRHRALRKVDIPGWPSFTSCPEPRNQNVCTFAERRVFAAIQRSHIHALLLSQNCKLTAFLDGHIELSCTAGDIVMDGDGFLDRNESSIVSMLVYTPGRASRVNTLGPHRDLM